MSLRDAGFRPFDPVYPVVVQDNGPEMIMGGLNAGLQAWDTMQQRKLLQAEKEAALKLAAEQRAQEVVDPVEAMRLAREMIGDARGLSNPYQDYDIGSTTQDAISAASGLATTAGSNMRPRPIQIQPTAPLGAAAVAPYSVPADAPPMLPAGIPTSLSSPAPAPVATPAPVSRAAPARRAPPTQGTVKSATDIARTLGQIRVTNDAATGRMDERRERNRFEALKLAGQMGMDALKLRQQALDTMSKERIAVMEAKAKAADRTSKDSDKAVERLRDYAAAAWKEFSSAREQSAKLASSFGGDAAEDTEIYRAYQRFAAQAEAAQAIYFERKAAYDSVMRARGLTETYNPFDSVSDAELRKKLLDTGYTGAIPGAEQ